MYFRPWLGNGRTGAPSLVRSESDRFKKCDAFARREVPPGAERQTGQRQRSNPNPPQSLDGNFRRFHHLAHDVIDPFVDRDRENQSLAARPKDAKLRRYDLLAIDRQSVSHALERGVRRSDCRDYVIFLFELIAWMHNTIGDVAIVGEQQESLSFAIESTDWIDALFRVNQIHDGPAITFVFRRRDIAPRLVEQNVPGRLGLEQNAVDSNL
jgi:hypothetical protein